MRCPLLVLVLFAGGSSQVGAQEPGRSETTIFRGVDHFMWAVRDLDAAPAFFRDTLGFEFVGSRNKMGSIENFLIWLPDGSYLEPLGPYNPESEFSNALDRWLQVHEGAWKIGFNAEPLQPLYERFQSLDWTAYEPGPGTFVAMDDRLEIADEMWRGLTLWTPPGNYIFFWHFTEGWEEMKEQVPELDPTRVSEHPNTAQGIGRAWVAVWDLNQTLDRFERMGMPDPGESFQVEHLQAEARQISFPMGDMVFVEPTSWESPVMDFLARRGENLMGITLIVSDLDQAERVLEYGFRTSVQVHQQDGGTQTLFIPADHAHGVFLEWAEQLN